EVPVAPAASAAAAPPPASSSDAAGAATYDTAVVPAPVYVAPAYVPYPYYYPAYYPAWYGPPPQCPQNPKPIATGGPYQAG
ncbi:hypothetical protein DN557_30955, partial [Burkholderia multivorans]